MKLQSLIGCACVGDEILGVGFNADKPDPIREVYEKWKKEEVGRVYHFTMFEEMWQAIKLHCEATNV